MKKYNRTLKNQSYSIDHFDLLYLSYVLIIITLIISLIYILLTVVEV